MSANSDWKVAIIGAGITGASAGQYLTRQGASVTIFDKGRGPGGRCATRRKNLYSFDHGAQYFTARESRFRKQVAVWAKSGTATHWRPCIGELSEGKFKTSRRNDLWVGTPGMNALSHAMLDGLHTRFDAKVRTIKRATDGWAVIEASGQRHPGFDLVLVTVPAPQVGPLLGEQFIDAKRAAADATMLPCWTLMLAFSKRLELPFDAAKLAGGDPISWLARNSSKPGRRDNAVDCWVVQADHEWSRQHIDLTAQQATELLLSAFSRICQENSVPATPPAHIASHRWRYALATPDVTQRCMIDKDNGLAVAGDWLSGGRIENAWLSGLAAAEALVANRHQQTPPPVGSTMQ